MNIALVVSQIVNGVQFGLVLFLLAAGLSLVFGIMKFINLAHGVFYMAGAYIGATVAVSTGSFLLAIVAAVLGTFALGLLLEVLVIRHLYHKDELDHVLATFGLLLSADAAVRGIWGSVALSIPLPDWLNGRLVFGGIDLPLYRAVIVGAGLCVAAVLWFVITRTRVGITVRAAASNAVMAQALGIDARRVFLLLFGAGAALAGFAGVLVGPITGATVGMGDQIVILAFVVIIIGGVGSVRGAFIGALAIGLIDTLGRAFLPGLLDTTLPHAFASAAGPALASVLIYLIMSIVLLVRPAGLFPPANR